jgi:hypothetical protein
MIMITIDELTRHLTADRVYVPALVVKLHTTRKALETFCETHHDDLIAAGVQLHVAVNSQTVRQRDHITVDGQHRGALSIPPRVDHVAEAIERWLEGRGAKTQKEYRTTLHSARRALVAAGLDLDAEPRAVAAALEVWSRSHRQAGHTPTDRTVATRLSYVSSFFDFALKTQAIAIVANPVGLLTRPQLADPRRTKS